MPPILLSPGLLGSAAAGQRIPQREHESGSVGVPDRLSQQRVGTVLVGAKLYDPAMSTRYACDYCGHEGDVPDGEPVDAVQCPRCGEPVTPLE